MRREQVPSGYAIAATRGCESVRVESADAGAALTVTVLDHGVVRVRHVHPNADAGAQRTTHAVQPEDAHDSEHEEQSYRIPHRQSRSVSGIARDANDHGAGAIAARFPCPKPEISVASDGASATITTDSIVISLTLSEAEKIPALSWTPRAHPNDPFLEDLPHRAYSVLKGSAGGCRHFVKRREGDRDLHYGMGERASPITLNGRRFRLETMDALGYNAETTDPLYKLIPFYVTLDTKTRVAHGVFYDSFAEGYADFGQEIDAFWGPYRSHTLIHGPHLDMYIFYGPSVASVISHYTYLTGRPRLPPKYSLGYLASAMGYAESEDAQRLIAELPQQCRKWGVGCDLLHLSSGYTVDPVTGARNVFTWNKKRFPKPDKLIHELRSEGIRISANVKPWLLSQHPNYKEVHDAQGFIKDAETSKPRVTRLWSAGNGATATGSYFDLSSTAGRAFWKRGVTSLLEMGIESIWNDNNEFSLPDNTDIYAHANIDYTPTTVGAGGRALQTHLMASASHEAMTSFNPRRRAFLITRSFASGVQRFVSQSWSGDNYTSWHTLKHNIPMGLNAGLGGCVGYGHDIGGFVGPRPSPELFVRWIQNGIWMPRFCVHSWKDEGVTELWMYPEVFPIIQKAVHLRYKILPYLYSLYHDAALTGMPVIRPLVLEFQFDPLVQSASFEFMLGPHLLIASVFDEGAKHRALRLPQDGNSLWCNIWTGEWVPGGTEVTVSCPLSMPGAVFARRGAIVPTGPVLDYVGKPGADHERVLWVFPPPSASSEVFQGQVYEDDGETVNAPLSKLNIKMRVHGNVVEVCVSLVGDYQVEYEWVWVLLPVGDSRRVVVAVGDTFGPDETAQTRSDSEGRLGHGIQLHSNRKI